MRTNILSGCVRFGLMAIVMCGLAGCGQSPKAAVARPGSMGIPSQPLAPPEPDRTASKEWIEAHKTSALDGLDERRIPMDRLVIGETIRLESDEGGAEPAVFERPSAAFWPETRAKVEPNVRLVEETPLGPAVRLGGPARNVLDASLAAPLACQAEGQVSWSSDAGTIGLVWRPPKPGATLELTTPALEPRACIEGNAQGMFVALCFSACFQADVPLHMTMTNPRENERSKTKPTYIAAGTDQWQRASVAMRFVHKDACTIQLVAHDAGVVRLTGMQLDPRSYPTDMGDAPMQQGWQGEWAPAGASRAADSLRIPLKRGQIPAEGAISCWFQTDWPSENFPHTVFEIEPDAFGLWFDAGRLMGAVGGTQVWVDQGVWMQMMRFGQEGLWHHAVLTWDKGGCVCLYVDGECYSRRTTSKPYRLAPERMQGPLCLGLPADPQGFRGLPSMPSRLDGLLADFRIYHAALSDAEVAAITLAGRAKLERASFERGPERQATLTKRSSEVLARGPYYCWFPNVLAQALDGTLMAWLSVDPDYGGGPDYWREVRSPITLLKAPADKAWHEGPITLRRQPERLPDGRWLAVGDEWKPVVSRDGVTWSEVHIKFRPYRGIEVASPNRSVLQWYVDSRRRVLALCQAGGQFTLAQVANTNGNDWELETLSLIMAGQMPPYGSFCEEDRIVEGRPGELLFVGRMFDNDLPCYQVRSVDGGRTWSKAEMCPFGAVWPIMVRTEDGVVFCHVGRPECVIHWTVDSGRTWSPPTRLFDSREVPLQAMGSWYGASTGYGELIAPGSNRLLETHDVLGDYDPATMTRGNACFFTEFQEESIGAYPERVAARIGAERFTLKGRWESDRRVGGDGLSIWTRDPGASARVEFEGTGVALIHPLLREGGKFTATVDGQAAAEVDLYDALPHHRFGRDVLASGLTPGKHVLELRADLSGAERYAHGDGAELEGIRSWMYLTDTTAARWAGLCRIEALK